MKYIRAILITLFLPLWGFFWVLVFLFMLVVTFFYWVISGENPMRYILDGQEEVFGSPVQLIKDIINETE